MLSEFALQHVPANVNFKTIRTYIPSSMQQGFTHHFFFTIRISKKTKFAVTHWNHQTVQQLQSLITMTWTRQPTTTLIFYSPKIAWLKVSIARNHKSSLMSSYLATKFERPPTASSESSIPQQSKVTTLVKHIRYIITPGPQQFTTTMFSNDIGYETW